VRFIFQFCLLTCLAVTWLRADDLAVLRNGNSIRHARREVLGRLTRLYLSDSSGGYIEIPTDQIDHFESDPTPTASTTPAARVNPASVAANAPQPNQANSAAVDPQTLNWMVNGAGQRNQIDPDFINSVIRAESGFNSRAVSKKGAQGLMQLMPQTASQLGVTNSFDPNSNVEGGTKYLRELLEKYNYDVPKALAAYNAGPRRVDQYRGVPPYTETRAYVAKIISDFNRKKIAENPGLARKSKSSSRLTPQTAKRSEKARSTKTAAVTSIPHDPETASR
jgi:Transglycosylase SLT domain